MKYLIGLKNKPTFVVLAAAKVEVFLLIINVYDFILEKFKIQNNVIEISWKMGVKRLLF